jgi:hypothetical protein
MNRKALPKPDMDRPSATPSISANNPLEKQIKQIWEKLLPVKNFGVEDNFFDLGGYSLLAVRVLNQLKPSFPSLTLIDIFTYPTVRSLAQSLRQGHKELAASSQGQSRGHFRKRLKEGRQKTFAAAVVHAAPPLDKQEI